MFKISSCVLLRILSGRDNFVVTEAQSFLKLEWFTEAGGTDTAKQNFKIGVKEIIQKESSEKQELEKYAKDGIALYFLMRHNGTTFSL